MRTQLGMSVWQTVLLFIAPPLLIALFVVWRAVRRATTHPDGNVLTEPKQKRKKRN